ncbi:MAG: DUF4168 domain-containing protein [Pleurocapsa sp. MO_192.B19]|nr:DUF4168 domain-containing protein [Pleurocapsa sp. MO_192.B19]
MSKVNLALPKLNKIYIRIVTSSVLAAIGLLSGFSPEASRQSSSVSFTAHAYAQQFTPEETENYAKAGYQVELLRRQVYKEIKNIINEPPPNIICDQQETLQKLNSNIRKIADRYCNQSRLIVQQNNLTINRFNQLKTYYDRRDDFYQRVQNILLKIQN